MKCNHLLCLLLCLSASLSALEAEATGDPLDLVNRIRSKQPLTKEERAYMQQIAKACNYATDREVADHLERCWVESETLAARGKDATGASPKALWQRGMDRARRLGGPIPVLLPLCALTLLVAGILLLRKRRQMPPLQQAPQSSGELLQETLSAKDE